MIIRKGVDQMKFIMIIANEEYREQMEEIADQLHCHGIQIANTGEFLQYGEIIYLIGLPKPDADQLVEHFKKAFASSQDETETHMRIYIMNMASCLQGEGGSIINACERIKGS